jgi:hypothetical protein
MTADQVRVNQQMDLFGATSRFRPMPHRSEFTTWCLLIQAAFYPRDEFIGTHIAQCELSLPLAIDEDGFVCEWSERIILEPVRLDDIPTRRENPDDDEGETEIDVPVTRR